MADELTLDMLGSGTPDNPEEGIQTQSVEPTPTEPTKVVPTVYTPEELKTIDHRTLDINRVPPEYRPWVESYQKSLQGDYTRKTQALADERRKVTAQPTIEEMYDQNPDGIMDQIDMAIIQAKREDPFSEKVIQLEAVQKKLLRRDLRKQSEESTATRNISFAQEAIRKNIPDFDSKREKLNEFVERELGIQGEELSILTDPNVMGPLAIKLTKAVNTIFDRFNVLSQADKKEVKPKPPQLERAGSSEADKSTRDPMKMSYPEYKKWREANP